MGLQLHVPLTGAHRSWCHICDELCEGDQNWLFIAIIQILFNISTSLIFLFIIKVSKAANWPNVSTKVSVFSTRPSVFSYPASFSVYSA